MKDLALLLIRIVSGGTLAAHGYTKLFGGEGRKPPQILTDIYGQNFAGAVQAGGPAKTANGFESMGVPYPAVAAYASGLAELLGGLALVTGFRTRLAALIVCANMLVAIYKVHWKTGLYGQGGYEFPLQLAGAAGALVLAGPGAISIDGIVGGTKQAAEAVSEGVQSATGAVGDAAGAVGGLAGAVGSGAIDRAEEAAQALAAAGLLAGARKAAGSLASAVPGR